MSDSECSFNMMDEESLVSVSDFSDEENVKLAVKPRKGATKVTAAAKKKPVAAAKKKKTVLATKCSNKKPVADDSSDDDDSTMAAAPKSKPNSNKTIEETYQKKSQLEHILIRPDTYIGSTEPITQNMFILNTMSRIVEKEITFTPGLYKIFDEIVVNAADNKQRDPNMNLLNITVDAENNLITVKNNGSGIPVVKHKEHDCYVPTLIFGHLLTGSNFDDKEKKTTGGRNGYGAKLANVFSTKFIVECMDSERGLKFNQVFRDNMSVADQPTVVKAKAAEVKKGDYTQISFSPDLKRFKMDHLDADTVGLLSKRAYDMAGSMANSAGKTKIVVSLNGKKLPIKSFKQYLATFDGLAPPIAYASDDRWEVGISCSSDATMTQVSFVNSICTSKGGNHVSYISDQVAAHLIKFLKKKKKTDLKKAQIVCHLNVMVNALIENPTFDSQTKDHLTLTKKGFGSTFVLPPEFLKKLETSDLVEKIMNYANFKSKEAMKRKGGVKKLKLTGIAKLEDANFAGGAKSSGCTLILTEGDSAKSLAMAGISVVGRDNYGVFPLRGKMKNVRQEGIKATKCEEVINLVNILGLKYHTTYDATTVKKLRYGSLMIMADQDTDGSHIKGLVVNFLHFHWPSLLDIPGFLKQFITPIVKAKLNENKKNQKIRTFFTMPEYESWTETAESNSHKWNIKYYKGLGTSTSAEAKEYFSDLGLHEIDFTTLSSDVIVDDVLDDAVDVDDDTMEFDVQPTNNSLLPKDANGFIDMIFNKDRTEDRKRWLTNTDTQGVYVDYVGAGANGMRYTDFINREYILFSLYDNERSIPNVIDGFKPSQRKVLFGCFKKKLFKNEIKVAQLSGYIAEHTAYHHGDVSLQQTIIAMAQNFVASNNVNLLYPSGQFGTRRMGGADAASPRYVNTRLEPIASILFHPDDFEVLDYLVEDGMSIEPTYFVPIIPMLLVNGASGIGTGWSCSVPNYNPRDIIANIRRMLGEEEMVPMNPWYNGFIGDIVQQSQKDKYVVTGNVERVDDNTISITELPLKKWTQNFKEFLEAMIVGTDKSPAEITDFSENHLETTVSFTVTADKSKIDEFEKGKDGLMGKFKLSSSMKTSNMVVFSKDRKIVKYDTPEQIIEAFYGVRFEFYEKRKAFLVSKLVEDKKKLSNKARFVEEVCDGKLIVTKRKRKDILEELQERGYDLITAKKKASANEDNNDDEDSTDDIDEEPSTAELGSGFEYLLGMKIWSLTYEKAQLLRDQLQEKAIELDNLQATSPKQLWLNDLDALDAALDERDKEIDAAAKDQIRAQNASKKSQAKKKTTAKKGRKKKVNEWDSNDEESNDDTMAIDSDDVVVTKPKPRSREAPAKKVDVAPKKLVVKKAPAKKKDETKSSKNDKELELLSESSDDDMSLSLSQRMKSKLMVSPPSKKQQGRDSYDSKKRPSPKLSSIPDSDESQDDEIAIPKSTRPAAGTKAKKTVTKKKQVVLELDSSEDEFDISDGSSVNEDVAAPPARGRRGQAQKTTYKFGGDSSDEESDYEF